jgi:hypothetical protein
MFIVDGESIGQVINNDAIVVDPEFRRRVVDMAQLWGQPELAVNLDGVLHDNAWDPEPSPKQFLVLQLLCAVIGECARMPEYECIHSGYDEETGIWRILDLDQPPFPLPPPAAWPFRVGFISRSRMTDGFLEKLSSRLPETDEVEINRGRITFRDLMEAMVLEKEKDLVAIRN